MSCRPMMNYYGGKWRAAPRYPKPEHDTIVEPFAGGAGYSLRYPDRNVVLVERDPEVAATWRYLIGVSPEEIRGLPLLEPGQHIDDFFPALTKDQRRLVGWWLSSGISAPRRTLTNSVATRNGKSNWRAVIRERIATQVGRIRHWRIIEGDYTSAPDIDATWFVDPPYIDKGKHYRFGSDDIDYAALGEWCQGLRGQVMVCENEGADWLPFRAFGGIKSLRGVSKEVVWP